ncbi:MAG: VOC family protein [Burkholderiales bacterium]|nr:VOC family protein [Burkholderiales bacterium]
MSRLTVDHVVIIVRDLPCAVRDFANLGFSVSQGGVHEGGLSHNALILLEDGSYLELFAPVRPLTMTLLVLMDKLGVLGGITSKRTSIVRRFLEHVARGEGIADIALLTDSLDEQLESARRNGLPMDKPLLGSRIRPDGQESKWRFGVPMMNGLPFLIEDLTPRMLRVPENAARRHANGVSGIARIDVEVSDRVQANANCCALLGLSCDTEPRQVDASKAALYFRVSGVDLALVECTDDEWTGRGSSAKTRPGQISLRLRTTDKANVGPLDSRQTHNARIELVSA